MQSAGATSPPRTVNRWTLEPLAIFLLPLTVAFAAMVYWTLGSKFYYPLGVAILVVVIVLFRARTLAATRRNQRL